MIQTMIHNTHRRTFLKAGLVLPFAFGRLFAAQNDAHAKLEAAKAEAQKQIENGIIMGTVFGTTEGVAACGMQTKNPPRPMRIQSRFDIASVGKTFTANCCAMLVADGKIDPDAPFTKYLPEHKLGKNCKITVRNLANHSSGFDNQKEFDSPDKNAFLRGVYNKMPVREPLAKYEYSCYNFILLGFVVEHVSGMRLDAFAKTRIWTPLGMNDTMWDEPGGGEYEVEHFYPNRPAGQHNDTLCKNFGAPLGNGSAFSTCQDMVKFVDDIAHRRKFSKEYYDLISTCQFQNGEVKRSFGWDMSEGKIPATLRGEHAISHSGWTGQTIFANPDTGKSAVVLTSRTGKWAEAIEGRKRIAALLTA